MALHSWLEFIVRLLKNGLDGIRHPKSLQIILLLYSIGYI